MAPTRIAGRYDLQDQLGEGGMGVVWRALDLRIGTHVAVKLMKDVSDPLAVELFTREWQTLAEMYHPNIVDVRDVGVFEENRQAKPFFVMPLLRGATLAELIANASARLTVMRIVEITSQVCRGLQAAHQRGLVHRDLKPSNIFVMDDDSAKIIDFGVVRLAGSKSATGQKGTLQYMSPEQAQLGEITSASDLFSLGVTLYEALTLRKPFARATVEETVEAVVKHVPPPVSEINPGVNHSISQVVHRCLAKRPVHRIASARELAELLQKAFRNEPVFDSSKIEPRLERARAELKSGDPGSASETLGEIEAEGHLDPRITVLRTQIDLSAKEKRIRKLLESASARVEQDEIPLALDKLREILELDPENAEALAIREKIEKQRSENQIAKWFELAETHLSNREFGAARRAAQEVLAIRRADTRALDLLERIESMEAESRSIRDRKEQLYSSALRAYQHGEIDSALSKLEHLISVARANPNAAVPERDAVYQTFYTEVRSERDIIHNGLEEAHRHYVEKNFAGAMKICQELMARYPNDPTFHALKIRIEDAERQELSAYIADVSKLVESEPDLDRRANILNEACGRYPNEVHFAQQLKLVRERRDLVNSIVAKARQYDERGQYAEAINQWDILRNIHPQYPGIAFERQECEKKRARQAREEEHGRLVEEIDARITNRNYDQAIARVDLALRDFPGDAELSGLRVLAEQSLQRSRESRRLFEEGQHALAENDLMRAADLLRSGFRLDPRAPGLRESLVNVLAERARLLVNENWSEAEPLYHEANQLDSGHPAVRALRSSISEAKRQTFVGQCLAECRNLVAGGLLQEAAERVRAARIEYPNDVRLEQYATTLEREISECKRKEEREKDITALSDDRRLLEQKPDRAAMQAVLERSYIIKAKYPDDPDIGKSVAQNELTIKQLTDLDDLSALLYVNHTAEDITKLSPKVEGSGSGEQAVDRKAKIQPGSGKLAKGRRNWEKQVAGVAAVAIIALGGGGLWHWLHTGRPKEIPPPPKPSIAFKVTPPGSTVSIGNRLVTTQSLPMGSAIVVSHLGYQTKQVTLKQPSDGNIALEPESVHISIETAEQDGQVELDGKAVADLSGGSLDDYGLKPDDKDHQLSIVNKGKRLFTLEFLASAGSTPEVKALDGGNMFVLTSLDRRVNLYGSPAGPAFQFGDQNIASDPSGKSIEITEANREIRFGEDTQQGSVQVDISNAPAIMVHSGMAEARLTITTNAEDATLKMDGIALKPGRGQWVMKDVTGQHRFEMSAQNYQTQLWTMNVQRGQTISKKIQLSPAPVARLANLVIRGGTPDAEVDLDGTQLGVLDSNGNFDQSGVVSNGIHTVTLRKSGYDDRRAEITSSNPASDVRLSNVALIPWATLSFQTTASNANVRFRRIGDTQFRDVSVSGKTHLPPGQYEIVANALGYNEIVTTAFLSGGDLSVPLNFVAIKDFFFLDPNQITHEGDWIKAKDKKDISLKPGMLNVNLVFTHPGKDQFGNKKLEWFVVTANHQARIHYILEGNKLKRKLEIGHVVSDENEVTVDTRAQSEKDISVVISVEGSRTRIANYKHAVQDDYTVPNQSFSGGTLVIRPGTDVLFMVKRDNPS